VQSGTEDGGVDLGDLRDELEDVAREKRDRIVWWGQSRYAEEVKTEIDAEAVDQMSSTLAGDG
jgi:glycine/serine hydroxymethyltransferase